MLTERSILCAVDFSERSRVGLMWASAIAQHRGADLTVLSVVEPLLARAVGIGPGGGLTLEETKPALREFVEANVPERARQSSQVRMEVVEGDPSEAILQTSRRLNADLIVMGTHGRRGLVKLLLGSTTETVLRQTERPVLAVPAGAVGAPDVQHPSVQLRKILLATDFRASALAATQWVGDLVSDISVPLVLAHVVEPLPLLPRWQALVADFESELVASGQRMLARLAADFRDAHPECVVSIGRPADTIATMAVQAGAGLVVMGLADREVAEPGRTAYGVLRNAHVAVVVVPARALRHKPSQNGQLADVPREKVEHLAAASENHD